MQREDVFKVSLGGPPIFQRIHQNMMYNGFGREIFLK
jgi:hypothetical protein